MNNTTACLRALDAFYLTTITSEKKETDSLDEQSILYKAKTCLPKDA
ncbi:hypothetical protein LOD44_10100 [Xylella fastidiosa subsp. multiplex]|uniref:Transposase n=1 Tax=Xylella fastidiosa subsp. multiplex TaxID=644357 RepID=A0AAW6HWE4_XYLFS|nr:hypothetical protein [Xylella fastidiosa]ERI59263.1 hypothetical protein M233_10505 [Xylella fastidiosa subsp. multiplex Griffin-1]MBE0269993.1 hypothetical protein [Xylella fastidiosa subsp. multiplex]MBE0283192.1 hypothetical protein [Xylella fastidiosa subsp. multiplex]MBS9486872.1 hypothetical protein [Xylella fastidiosa subsp. multiplex]MDC6408318.1 hypothetical protein [Xylella fastidiosa subsp. multiplex]